MRLAALPALALLAGCAAEKEPEPAPTPAATVAEPRTLVAADFDPATLGARVAGMDVTDGIIGDAKEPLARFSAYVACAKEIAACDPAQLPPETRYTYVLTVTPVAPATPETPAATPSPIPPTLAMRDAAPGFDGAVGYSLAEAAAALGAEDALSITLDQGRVIWRANTNAWQGGLPITVWWQTTRPPEKASAAYDFSSGSDSDSAEVTAPFPAADKPVERNR